MSIFTDPLGIKGTGKRMARAIIITALILVVGAIAVAIIVRGCDKKAPESIKAESGVGIGMYTVHVTVTIDSIPVSDASVFVSTDSTSGNRVVAFTATNLDGMAKAIVEPGRYFVYSFVRRGDVHYLGSSWITVTDKSSSIWLDAVPVKLVGA